MVVENTYNASNGNLLTTVVDKGRLNLTSAFGYNAVGDQTSIDGPLPTTDGGNDVILTTYDEVRRPVAVVQLNGTKTTTIYDKSSRDTRTEIRDRNGNLLQSTGKAYTPTGKVSFTYDQGCFSDGVLQPGRSSCALTRTTYDGLDRVNMVIDPENRITKTIYDAAGQTLRVVRAYGTELQQDYQTYSYTQNGQVATVKDANGNLTAYHYDEFDRLMRTNFPSKTKGSGLASSTDYETYEYDANGNQRYKRTRRGHWVESRYDALNRVTEIKGEQPNPPPATAMIWLGVI